MKLLCLLLSVCCLPSVQAAEIPAKDRIVVLISLDGLPAFVMEDPRLPVPTLRRLAREGAVVKRMTVSNPSVTWPVHTSMVTGVPGARHSVLYNGLLVRQGPKSPPRVEPYHDKTELVRAPTVYDLAHQAGLTTAQVDSGVITWT
jgi:predicted AlkP superfamily pyrophosphatase or phosphodiesterase